MLRKIVVLLGSAAVALAAVSQPAGASAPKIVPTGSVRCGLTGSMKLSRALPNAQSADGSTRNVHVKISAVMTNCSGGSPVTGGKLTISGFLEAGSSCNDISDGSPPDFTFDDNKMQAKWTGVSGSSTKASLGKSTTDIFSTGNELFGAWEYDSDSFGDNDAFTGESAVIDLVPDAMSGALIRACTLGLNDALGKPIDLSEVTFNAAGRSTISVAP